MKEGKFFYNYTASKAAYYSKFCCGVFTIKCDAKKDLVDEAWEELQKIARTNYPDADDINFTAFNKL
ncbi:MAG: hypothetical protein MJK15_05215 [Colwellia sp.]|nr:hypothetical protein [Colwellia sp.]